MPLDEPPPSRQPPRFVPTLTEIFVPTGAASAAPDEPSQGPLHDGHSDQPTDALPGQPEDLSADQSQGDHALDQHLDQAMEHGIGASAHHRHAPSDYQVPYQAAYAPAYQSTSQHVVAPDQQPPGPLFRASLPEERNVYLPDTAVIELLARMGPELDARLSETIAQVLHEQMPLLNARIRQAVAEVVRETVAKAAANPERR